jgi:ADP-heptose:LPS heptosyltransferase
MLKSLFNPLDRILRTAQKASQKSFLICWNRGLGDIPLGLYALVHRIREYVPKAQIDILTRSDLAPLFSMLEGVNALPVPSWTRGTSFSLENSLDEVGKESSDYDVIMQKPDPTRWLKWQLGTMIPRLEWNPEWDALAETFEDNCLGMHIDTETGQHYGYEKNWPQERWEALIHELAPRKKILLFGMKADEREWPENVTDLRGKTSLFTMLSLIKNKCSHLLAPDSGVLSVVYYVAEDYPLRLVSLWADPHQGVLRQDVSSPNPSLVHVSLIGEKENISNISLEQVKKALNIS